MSMVSWTQCKFNNRADYTAMASSQVETSLLSGVNSQPIFEAFSLYADNTPGKAILFKAAGVFSTTGTPTIIFQARLGGTVGASYLSGTSVGVSAAITTINNSSNARWELELTCIVNTPGLGTTNSTLSCNGHVLSPVGFASPYVYDLEPTTPATATWTATLDNAVAQYFNLSATWSASSSSNTITCKQLQAWLMN